MEGTANKSPTLVPARMINEFVYCPRLAYLEWVQGEFEESSDTLEGSLEHERVDTESGKLPEVPGLDEPIHASSVYLSAPSEGIVTKIDLVEGEGGEVIPIDYKKGRPPDTPQGMWDADRVQVAAQGLVLLANGYHCRQAMVYYIGSKERVTINLVDSVLEEARAARRGLLALAEAGRMPPPLDDSPKCVGCSLAGICLPDELIFLQRGGKGDKEEVRRIVPARDDPLPLYVQEQGFAIGKSGEMLTVKDRSRKIVEKVRLLDTSHVALMGNVQITTQAMRHLFGEGIPVCYHSYGGWFYGMTWGMHHKNIELRLAQFAAHASDEDSLVLARRFVRSKIRNSRTLLRRNSPSTDGEVPDPQLKRDLDRLGRLASKVVRASSVEELLGIEGSAARIYFGRFPTLIRSDTLFFSMQGRNRRPPKDPVNALLSFCYALLVKELTLILTRVGFDPLVGFYHRPRYGRPALALDLMEEFRPIIGDSVVLSVVNGSVVTKKDFIVRGGAYALTKQGRKKLIQAFERRLDSLVTHPIFGYRISYRRVLEVQARLLGRVLLGELDELPPFETR